MARGQSFYFIRRVCPSLPAMALGWFLSVLSPTAAFGQSTEDRILEFLEAASGFQLLGDIQSATLQQGQKMGIQVMLVEDADYMVVGFCGSGCNNLDLSLMDEFGELVHTDDLPDAEPVLMFRAESTGSFRVQVDAVDLSAPATNVAVGILGSTSEPGMLPGEDMSGRLTLVEGEFAKLGFTEMGRERVGSLNNDQAFTLPIELQSGREYRFAGVCDQDCFDLDLAIRDPAGVEVASDVLEDALPILVLEADTTGEYRVEVIMIACGLEPCSYRVAAFVKGEDVGPGGAAFSGEMLFHETYQGELDPEDETSSGAYVETFQVEAESGQRIIADLRSDEFDTLLRLVGPDGAREENDDYGYETGHSHIEMLAVADGTYTVQVTSFEPRSEGAFVLQIAVVE